MVTIKLVRFKASGYKMSFGSFFEELINLLGKFLEWPIKLFVISWARVIWNSDSMLIDSGIWKSFNVGFTLCGYSWFGSQVTFFFYTCCSSVTKMCLTLCDLIDCSTPGFPALHYLLEFAQTHVRSVSDAIQPSHPLSPPFPPAFNFSQHQGLF